VRRLRDLFSCFTFLDPRPPLRSCTHWSSGHVDKRVVDADKVHGGLP
jgi:hypothetical protein